MKTIKVFLASSEELTRERQQISEIEIILNNLLYKRKIKIITEKWEHLDSSLNKERKQNEYNAILRRCDICITMFWTKCGKYTNEEFQLAVDAMRGGDKPHKVVVLFKDAPDSEITPELREFKSATQLNYASSVEYFNNIDTLRLSFLTHLKLLIEEMPELYTTQDNQILVENMPLVDLNNITNPK